MMVSTNWPVVVVSFYKVYSHQRRTCDGLICYCRSDESPTWKRVLKQHKTIVSISGNAITRMEPKGGYCIHTCTTFGQSFERYTETKSTWEWSPVDLCVRGDHHCGFMIWQRHTHCQWTRAVRSARHCNDRQDNSSSSRRSTVLIVANLFWSTAEAIRRGILFVWKCV